MARALLYTPAGRDVVKNRGFTLIEVLVAMALTLLLIVGTAELVSFSLWAKHKGDRASGIARILNGRLETLKARPYDSPELGPGAYTATTHDGPSRTEFREEWTIEVEGEAMKKVSISVEPEGRPQAAATLILYISSELGFSP
jgi:prepilin-type N-terminal cleavage/methylation domain-containing protein